MTRVSPGPINGTALTAGGCGRCPRSQGATVHWAPRIRAIALSHPMFKLNTPSNTRSNQANTELRHKGILCALIGLTVRANPSDNL